MPRNLSASKILCICDHLGQCSHHDTTSRPSHKSPSARYFVMTPTTSITSTHAQTPSAPCPNPSYARCSTATGSPRGRVHAGKDRSDRFESTLLVLAIVPCRAPLRRLSMVRPSGAMCSASGAIIPRDPKPCHCSARDCPTVHLHHILCCPEAARCH